MLETDDVIALLNDLSQTCEDGEKGFRDAAEGLQDPTIRALFIELGEEREALATELQAEVRRLGGQPAESGSAAGAMHRGWINLKSALTGEDDAAIIAEAERGEDVAKGAYEKALETALPSEVQYLVQRQYSRVRAAHDQVRDLKHATSAH